MSTARPSADVIEGLRTSMEQMVHSYGPGAIHPTERIQGTGFFPGGSGIWQGMHPFSQLPELFPASPILYLGHNFDKVQGLQDSVRRGVEKLTTGTWKYLREYQKAADLLPDDAFYTNYFVGLQPLAARGKMVASDSFYIECRQFLSEQIRLVQPRLVAVLGTPAKEQWLLANIRLPAVFLLHPSSIWCDRSIDERKKATHEQGVLLRSAADKCVR